MSENDPPFGERSGTGDVRASSRIFVRRPLNEYSPFDEVFEFRATEPEQSAMDRDGDICYCRYWLTRENRNGIPGDSEKHASGGRLPIGSVPDEVRQRAAALVDWMDPDPDWEEEQDDE